MAATAPDRSVPSPTPALAIRTVSDADRESVMQLLEALPHLYPGAAQWLDRTWQMVLAGDAACRVAVESHRIVGVVIDKPKGPASRKLSTIFVAPAARGRGIGRALLMTTLDEWHERQVTNGYVTARRGHESGVRLLLESLGFRHRTTHLHRYGTDQHEDVFEWGGSDNAGACDQACSRRRDLLEA